MSANAVKAFESLMPHLRDMLAAHSLKADRRPPVANVNLVARHLAYVYDPDRAGYVDDTVDQVAAAVSLSSSQDAARAPGARQARAMGRRAARRVEGPSTAQSAGQALCCAPPRTA